MQNVKLLFIHARIVNKLSTIIKIITTLSTRTRMTYLIFTLFFRLLQLSYLINFNLEFLACKLYHLLYFLLRVEGVDQGTFLGNF
jgi:hypothetical protein